MSKIKFGKCLWIEDDVNYPDKERISTACKRLFGKEITEFEIIEEKDLGDATVVETKEGIIFYMSYPGNSAIYKAAKE